MTKALQHIDLDGSDISLKGEMVSLTGLWKAAGSDPSKKPAKWRELPATQEFVTHVSELIIRKSDLKAFSITKGRNGQTWAHWQIAMSYARYLSPEFAAKCNEIVRNHMEGKAPAPTGFNAELVEMIRQTNGIARMLAKKVTKIEKVIDNSIEPASATPALTDQTQETAQ